MDQISVSQPKKDYTETELINIKNQTYVQSQESNLFQELKLVKETDQEIIV